MSAFPGSDLEGATVRNTRIEEHVATSGERSLLAVQVTTQSGTCVMVVAADGQSLATRSTAVGSYDMGELGMVEEREGGVVAEVLPTGTVIRQALPLGDADGLTTGVKLVTSTDDALYIYNWGDDLRAGRTLPDFVKAELRPKARISADLKVLRPQRPSIRSYHSATSGCRRHSAYSGISYSRALAALTPAQLSSPCGQPSMLAPG